MYHWHAGFVDLQLITYAMIAKGRHAADAVQKAILVTECGVSYAMHVFESEWTMVMIRVTMTHLNEVNLQPTTTTPSTQRDRT